MFDPDSFLSGYNDWLAKFNEFDRQTRKLLEKQSHTFDVKVKHFYITRGVEVTVPCNVSFRLHTANNFDENMGLSQLIHSGKYDPEKHAFKVVKLTERPFPEVNIYFGVPHSFTHPNYHLRETYKHDHDMASDYAWFIGHDELSQETKEELERVSIAAWREKPGLAKDLLYTATNVERQKLNSLKTKINIYLAHCLWEQVIPKVFTEQQVKQLFDVQGFKKTPYRTRYDVYQNTIVRYRIGWPLKNVNLYDGVEE